MIASRIVVAGLASAVALVLEPALASDNSKSTIDPKTLLDSVDNQTVACNGGSGGGGGGGGGAVASNGGGSPSGDPGPSPSPPASSNDPFEGVPPLDQYHIQLVNLMGAVSAAQELVNVAQDQLNYAQGMLQMVQNGLLNGNAPDPDNGWGYTSGWGWVGLNLAKEYTYVQYGQIAGVFNPPNEEMGTSQPTQLVNMQTLLTISQTMANITGGGKNIVTQVQTAYNLTQGYVQNVLNKIQLTVNPQTGNWNPVGPAENPETNQLGYYLSNPNPSPNVVDYNLANQALAYWTQIVPIDQIILQRAQAALAQATQQLTNFTSANGPPSGPSPGSQTSDSGGGGGCGGGAASDAAADAIADAAGAADAGGADGD